MQDLQLQRRLLKSALNLKKIRNIVEVVFFLSSKQNIAGRIEISPAETKKPFPVSLKLRHLLIIQLWMFFCCFSFQKKLLCINWFPLKNKMLYGKVLSAFRPCSQKEDLYKVTDCNMRFLLRLVLLALWCAFPHFSIVLS